MSTLKDAVKALRAYGVFDPDGNLVGCVAIEDVLALIDTHQEQHDAGVDEKCLRQALIDMSPPDYTGWDDYYENIIGLCKHFLRSQPVPSEDTLSKLRQAFDCCEIFVLKNAEQQSAGGVLTVIKQANALLAALQQGGGQ